MAIEKVNGVENTEQPQGIQVPLPDVDITPRSPSSMYSAKLALNGTGIEASSCSCISPMIADPSSNSVTPGVISVSETDT